MRKSLLKINNPFSNIYINNIYLMNNSYTNPIHPRDLIVGNEYDLERIYRPITEHSSWIEALGLNQTARRTGYI